VYEKTPTHARNLEATSLVTYGFPKRTPVHCGMPQMP
jgi:hypothetical protein